MRVGILPRRLAPVGEPPALDHARDDVAAQVIREVAPVGRVEEDEVGRGSPARCVRSGRASRATWAALTVTAVEPRAGASWSWVQASEQTSGRLVVKELPGLKSVASAIAAPAATRSRAGGLRAVEEERAGRQQHADDVARRELGDPVRARRLEMVDGARAELDGERDRAPAR